MNLCCVGAGVANLKLRTNTKTLDDERTQANLQMPEASYHARDSFGRTPVDEAGPCLDWTIKQGVCRWKALLFLLKFRIPLCASTQKP